MHGNPPPIPSWPASILAFLGVLIGGFIGFWIGLGIGIAIAEATNMSSFEGQSGFFAFFIGLAGVLVGAIIGLVMALYWTRRKKPAVTPLSRATSASSSAIRSSRRASAACDIIGLEALRNMLRAVHVPAR